MTDDYLKTLRKLEDCLMEHYAGRHTMADAVSAQVELKRIVAEDFQCAPSQVILVGFTHDGMNSYTLEGFIIDLF